MDNVIWWYNVLVLAVYVWLFMLGSVWEAYLARGLYHKICYGSN
jgi:hypothetical protein